MYAASKTQIHTITLTDEELDQESINIEDLTVNTVDTDINIHGIFQNSESMESSIVLVALEAPDN